MTEILCTNLELVAQVTIELMKIGLNEEDLILMEKDTDGAVAMKYGERFSKLAITILTGVNASHAKYMDILMSMEDS